MASLRLACTVSEITSERTCGPYCWATILSGTLPGRKPATFTVFARCASRLCTSPSICSIGTATFSRRSSCPSVSSVVCILDDSLLDFDRAMVRKERLELSRLSAPAPKAGASTNSATFAADFAKRNGSIRRQSGSRGAKRAITLKACPQRRNGACNGVACILSLAIRSRIARVCRALRKFPRRIMGRASGASSGDRGDLCVRARRR